MGALRLVAAFVVLAFCCGRGWSRELGAGDLPADGQSLVLSETSTLTVAGGETGVLGGQIRLEGHAVLLTLKVHGELVLGPGSRIDCPERTTLTIDQPGGIRGRRLLIQNQEGAVNVDELGVQNTGSLELTAFGPFKAGLFSITNQGGAVAGVRLHADSGGAAWNVQNSGSFDLHNCSGRMNLPNFSLSSTGADRCEWINGGSAAIGNAALQNSGQGALELRNSGNLQFANLNVQTYGANLGLHNTGAFSVGNWSMKDQLDSSTVTSDGPLVADNFTGVANGAQGLVRWLVRGDLILHNPQLRANYGGTVLMDASGGSLTSRTVLIQTSGWSHGKASGGLPAGRP
jgi:hypothetical protein